MEKLQPLTLAQWYDRLGLSESLQAVLSVFWGYYGLPPSRLNALYYAIATGEYLVKGGQYYQSRSQDLSNTLMEAITQKGGKVLLETGAKRIGLKNGAVTGVKDVKGKVHPARAVIANANVPSVFGKLIPRDQVPAPFLTKLNSLRPALSSFVVWLGLNRELKGIEGYEIFESPNKTAEEDYLACVKGDMARAGMAVTLYDNLFQGYSKPGTSTVVLVSLCGYDYWKKFEADYRAGSKAAYTKEKNRLARIMIKRAEAKVIPGLSSLIEVKEVGTPLTNLRYTGNPQGSIYGYAGLSARLNQLEVKTPFKGLYLASAWTHGGGYTPTMMAGRDAVEALLGDWRAL